MSADLSTLSAKAEKAREAFEKAQAEAEQAQRLEAQRQAAAQRAADERFMAAYDDEQLGRDVRQAEQQVREAMAADPVFAALARVYAAQLRRAHLAAEAQGVASRLGDPRQITSRSAGVPTAENLMRYVADLGEDLHNAEQDD